MILIMFSRTTRNFIYYTYGKSKFPIGIQTFEKIRIGNYLYVDKTVLVTKTEACTAAGRSDVVVETNGAVYVFEFKLDSSAEDVLKQIDEKGYMIPYEVTKKADGTPKTLYKIGANFDMKTKTIEKFCIIISPITIGSIL